jgi:periplasmic divalent cation tolerance protein
MSRAQAKNKRIVLVTCPNLAMARKIARSVVQKRLAACVNVIGSPVESFYTWKRKLEHAREYLVVIKTVSEGLKKLEREVHQLHSYDVPEFIALPISDGSATYLSWLNASVKKPRK